MERMSGKVAYPYSRENEELLKMLKKLSELNIDENEKKLLWAYITHNVLKKEIIIERLKIAVEREKWDPSRTNICNVAYGFTELSEEEKKRIAKSLLTKLENNEIDIYD